MDREPPRTTRHRATQRQHGAAIVEAVIALPILLVVILGVIQFGLIYQAKATLNHASLQAARAGAVAHAEPQALRRGLAFGLLPLYSPDPSIAAAIATTARISAELLTDSRIRILNPTSEAFDDFSEDVEGTREIPNDRLHARSTAVGSRSGLNIQDANLLRVEVTYGYELKVPLVNWFISRVLLAPIRARSLDTFEQQLLRRGRIPLRATSTVRMQSPVRASDLMVSTADLPELPRIPADSRRPPEDKSDTDDAKEGDADRDDKDNSTAGTSGSGLDDDFLGFGGGPPESIETSEQVPPGSEPGQATDGDTTNNEQPSTSDKQDQEEPLCKATTTKPSEPEATGRLGEVWAELKRIAGEALEFVKGVWEGIKEQLGGMAELIAHPIEAAKGIYQLAKSFVTDFPGTVKMVAEALGKDFSTLIHCGAFDRGRLVGENINPAFMLKLATKLARLGHNHLARALDDTKKDFGCASFAAGTPVWLKEGVKPIQRVVAGDRVASRDGSTYEDSPQAVTHTFSRQAPRYLVLLTEFDSLRVTEEHPFWVQGNGWTPAKELKEGQVLASAHGDVLLMQRYVVDSPIEVFNFSVEQTKSYHVGVSGLWVHNANCHVPPIYRAPTSPSGYRIGESDGGIGSWQDVPRSSAKRSADDAYRYQEQITGAPRIGDVVREYDVAGVKFDGYDSERRVLIDAKHYTDNCPLADCKPIYLQAEVAKELVKQAQRQIDAIRNLGEEVPIEWHVADKKMTEKISAILNSGLDSDYAGRITIVFTPDLVN